MSAVATPHVLEPSHWNTDFKHCSTGTEKRERDEPDSGGQRKRNKNCDHITQNLATEMPPSLETSSPKKHSSAGITLSQESAPSKQPQVSRGNGSSSESESEKPKTKKSRDRPYTCKDCDAAFSRQHDLKRHQALHTGIKPYKCEICDRAFARLDALNRHKRAESGGCSGMNARNHHGRLYQAMKGSSADAVSVTENSMDSSTSPVNGDSTPNATGANDSTVVQRFTVDDQQKHDASSHQGRANMFPALPSVQSPRTQNGQTRQVAKAASGDDRGSKRSWSGNPTNSIASSTGGNKTSGNSSGSSGSGSNGSGRSGYLGSAESNAGSSSRADSPHFSRTNHMRTHHPHHKHVHNHYHSYGPGATMPRTSDPATSLQQQDMHGDRRRPNGKWDVDVDECRDARLHSHGTASTTPNPAGIAHCHGQSSSSHQVGQGRLKFDRENGYVIGYGTLSDTMDNAQSNDSWNDRSGAHPPQSATTQRYWPRERSHVLSNSSKSGDQHMHTGAPPNVGEPYSSGSRASSYSRTLSDPLAHPLQSMASSPQHASEKTHAVERYLPCVPDINEDYHCKPPASRIPADVPNETCDNSSGSPTGISRSKATYSSFRGGSLQESIFRWSSHDRQAELPNHVHCMIPTPVQSLNGQSTSSSERSSKNNYHVYSDISSSGGLLIKKISTVRGKSRARVSSMDELEERTEAYTCHPASGGGIQAKELRSSRMHYDNTSQEASMGYSQSADIQKARAQERSPRSDGPSSGRRGSAHCSVKAEELSPYHISRYSEMADGSAVTEREGISDQDLPVLPTDGSRDDLQGRPTRMQGIVSNAEALLSPAPPPSAQQTFPPAAPGASGSPIRQHYYVGKSPFRLRKPQKPVDKVNRSFLRRHTPRSSFVKYHSHQHQHQHLHEHQFHSNVSTEGNQSQSNHPSGPPPPTPVSDSSLRRWDADDNMNPYVLPPEVADSANPAHIVGFYERMRRMMQGVASGSQTDGMSRRNSDHEVHLFKEQIRVDPSKQSQSPDPFSEPISWDQGRMTGSCTHSESRSAPPLDLDGVDESVRVHIEGLREALKNETARREHVELKAEKLRTKVLKLHIEKSLLRSMIMEKACLSQLVGEGPPVECKTPRPEEQLSRSEMTESPAHYMPSRGEWQVPRSPRLAPPASHTGRNDYSVGPVPDVDREPISIGQQQSRPCGPTEF